MRNFGKHLWRAFGRVWPACVTQAQAAAFNMFLAFFPMLLLVLGVVSRWAFLRDGVKDVFSSLGPLMPPGSAAILQDFLAKHAEHPLSWASVGLIGTLLAGTQTMRLLIEGFHLALKIERPPVREQVWRALLLLCLTLGPTVLAVVIAVFGKQMRITIAQEYGSAEWIEILFSVALTIISLVLAMFVLAVVYRVGTRGVRNWRDVLPGAMIATPLWWLVSFFFGFYLRHVPYNLVYGGLATAIGLMLWMNLTMVIILLGEAFNAERYAHSRAIAAS